MKSQLRSGLAVVGAMSLLCLAWNLAPSRAQNPKANGNPAWEYKTIQVSSVDEQQLNDLGSEGWELVTIYAQHEDAFRPVFKRPAKVN